MKSEYDRTFSQLMRPYNIAGGIGRMLGFLLIVISVFSFIWYSPTFAIKLAITGASILLLSKIVLHWIQHQIHAGLSTDICGDHD